MEIKRQLVYHLNDYMEFNNLTKIQVAKDLEISRSELSMILNPEDDSITLKTFIKIAKYIGKNLRISFE